jgi:hypothetical protein
VHLAKVVSAVAPIAPPPKALLAALGLSLETNKELVVRMKGVREALTGM